MDCLDLQLSQKTLISELVETSDVALLDGRGIDAKIIRNSKDFIAGTTWNQRLLVQSVDDFGSKTPKNMTLYDSFWSLKKTRESSAFAIETQTGIGTLDGHLIFQITSDLTQIAAGFYIAEIGWYLSEDGSDYYRYQYEVEVKE